MFRISPIRYRSPDDAGGAPALAPAAPAQPAPKPADFADALMKALEDRTQRAEKGVLKSMAEQYGMTEAEAAAVLDKHKAEKAKALPEDAQRQIDAAKAEVQRMKVETALAKEGAALGLVDPDAAMLLMPKDAVKINDKGEVTGLKEALEALQKSKPYLFGSTKPAAMAQKVGGVSPAGLSPVEEAFYRKNPNIRPK